MTSYKVCILCAGRGTRNTSIEGLHKSLLPISNKAVISKIIESYPKSVPVVVAVGYKANQIKSYLNSVYSDRDITFVDVKNFDGAFSGPGLSLLSCKDELQCPFIFTSSDTIFEDASSFANVKKNWIGVSKVSPSEAYKYCLVKQIKNKLEFYYNCNVDASAFTGIAGVKDYKLFWEGLSTLDMVNDEHQVTNGLRALQNVDMKEMKWYDTGNIISYNNTKKIFPNDIVIEKDNESIFIDKGLVVKYFSDSQKNEMRVKRSTELFGFSPTVTKINKNMFCYDYIPGKRLSDIVDKNVLKYFLLDYHENFLKKSYNNKTYAFLTDCDIMYRQKTHQRTRGFVGSPEDRINKINGTKVLKVDEMLSRIDWNAINQKARPGRFHGDLQPENIIYSDSGKYVYIDWRESFGKSFDVGDVYYDLGKLYHALIISNTLILKDEYNVAIDKSFSQADISFNIKNNLLDLLNILEEFCDNKDYDFHHVKLVGVLNYLNIATLYNTFKEGEYSKFLFLLGKKMLQELLNEEIK